MTIELPRSVAQTIELAFPEEALDRYWAVWQFPEARYAYMIGFRREAWLIVMDSQEAGEAYLASDARMNGRSPAQYRLDELTLPDAFDAVRAQPVPFVSSQGTTVRRVLGIEIRTLNGLGTREVQRIVK